MKSTIKVKCPECKGILEIDVVHEKVIAHKHTLDDEATEQDKDALFDDVLGRVKARHAEGDALFDKVKESVERNDERLDQLFGEMKDKIDKAKDADDLGEDPRNPFWD